MTMTDPRLERLRTLDTAATPGLWHVSSDRVVRGPNGSRVAVLIPKVHDAALIAAMRNAWPAVVTLLESVLERHVTVEREPTEDDPQTWFCAECGWGGEQRSTRQSCLDADAAQAVLDTLDPP